MPLLVGLLVSAYGLANAAIQPFTARLTDRVGRYKLLIQIGLVVLAASTWAFVYATRFLDLLLLRVVQGAALALEIPATMALLALASRKETRGGTMGFYTTMRMVGLGLGPVIGGFLHDTYGNEAAFVAGAVVLLVAAVVVQFGVRRQATPGERRRLAESGAADASAAGSRPAGAGTRQEPVRRRHGHVPDGRRLVHPGDHPGERVQQPPGHRRLRLQPGVQLADGLAPVLPGAHGKAVGPPRPQALRGVGAGGAGRRARPSWGRCRPWWFIAARFVQGIAAAAIVAPAIAYAGDIAQGGGGGQEGRQMSTVTIGFGLRHRGRALLAGILATVFFERRSWRRAGSAWSAPWWRGGGWSRRWTRGD